MAMESIQPKQCPYCHSEETTEYDFYTTTNSDGEVDRNIVIMECDKCKRLFTEYYSIKWIYIGTYWQLDD